MSPASPALYADSLLLILWGCPIIGYYLLSVWSHWFLFYSKSYNPLLWQLWCSGCTRLDTGTKSGPRTGWRPEAQLAVLGMAVLLLLWLFLLLELWHALVTRFQAWRWRMSRGTDVGGSFARGWRGVYQDWLGWRICCFLSDHSCPLPLRTGFQKLQPDSWIWNLAIST